MRRTPGLDRMLFAAAFTVVAVGCGLGQGQASPGASAPPEPPKTIIGQLFDRLSADGVADKQLALDAFSTVIAPLPGAAVASAESLAGLEIKSGSFAIRWLSAYYDELTPEQRQVYDDAITPGPSAVRVEGANSDGENIVGNALGLADATAQEQAFASMLKEAGDQLATRLGRKAASVWSVEVVANEPTWLGATGYGSALGCTFHFAPRLATRSERVIRTVIAHEMFHCFQYSLIGTAKGAPYPSWIIEGQAEYVGEAVAGPSEAGLPPWETYLSTAATRLFERDYDASGFYWQLAESGVDPWPHLDAMLRSVGNNVEAFKAAGAMNESFLTRWASGLGRRPALGQAWTTTAAGWNTMFQTYPTQVPVATGATAHISVPMVTNDLYQVTSQADIVEVRIKGHGRLRTSSGDVTQLAELWLCTDPGGCKCPEGQRYNGPELQSAPQPVDLGVTGALAGAEGDLTGHDLKEFCEPEETPRPDGSCDQCAMSNGDPHIVTVDQDEYDFMAVGEFVLLRSTDGSFELQARQEPYSDSRTVSVNTALAMKAGNQRIGVYATEADGLEIRVDGRVIDPGAGTITVGGATVTPMPREFAPGVEVTFADGTRLVAFGEFEYGINVTLEPSDALRASAEGLMGPITGDGLDLPSMPDGTTELPDGMTRHEYREALYGPFESAWRVGGATSLFDYAPGTSTETFTDDSFPDREELLTFDDLTDAQLAFGQPVCADVTDLVLLQQCLFDVFVTGDTGFGEMYEISLNVVETGALPSSGAQARVVNFYTENGQPVEVDVYAYTWSETESMEAAALVATVPYGQASDWFNPGLVQPPFLDDPYTKVQIFRRGQQTDPLVATSEFLGPGTVTSIVVYQDEVFEGQPGAWLSTIYARHPTNPVPQSLADAGLLVTRNHGLAAEDPEPFLYASVGDGCLEHPLADPSYEFPQPQPIGNELRIAPGDHTLTLHAAPAAGEVPLCDDKTVGPGAALSVAPGDRYLVFPYRLPGATEISTLLLPLER